MTSVGNYRIDRPTAGAVGPVTRYTSHYQIRGLDIAFSRVYGTEPTLSIVEQVKRAAVILLLRGHPPARRRGGELRPGGNRQ
jgi:hypothetical protein